MGILFVVGVKFMVVHMQPTMVKFQEDTVPPPQKKKCWICDVWGHTYCWDWEVISEPVIFLTSNLSYIHIVLTMYTLCHCEIQIYHCQKSLRHYN